MKKKIIRLTEQDLHNMINECVARVLREGEYDIDQDNYYGGGLPDSYNKEDAPEKSEVDWNALGEISNQLTPMVNKLFDMANNSDGNTDWLFTIAYELEKGDKSLKAFLQHEQGK